MAIKIRCQLSKTKGLSKILYFYGLDYSVVVHPTIHGEPILTSQAFYYLEHLECVAEVRFENHSDRMSDREIEYLLDNYLFVYSTTDDSSRISTKVTDMKYVVSNNHMYSYYDQGCTEALILDKANDESVIDIETIDSDDNTDFSHWCLIENYSESIIDDYVSQMAKLIDKKAIVKVLPDEDRDGYFGKIKLIECTDGLLDYYQAQKLDYSITPRDIKPNQEYFTLDSSFKHTSELVIPVETIKSTALYNPLLLSYYFSGLKESNPLQGFVGFYNVLEYYFEEAPLLLNKKANIEREQLKCVVELISNESEIYDFISKQEGGYKVQLTKCIKSSSSVSINGFDSDDKDNLITNVANWLYSIRCAVVHSKKTRKGKTTAIFEPYTPESDNLSLAIPLIKWLSIQCVFKDNQLSKV